MAQSVSNDALWEKLSEISERINRLSIEQKSQVSSGKQAENTPDFSSVKDEIFTEIERQSLKLGMHGDSNYQAINKNIRMLHEDITRVLNIVRHIRKQQKQGIEPQVEKDSEQQLEPFETQVKDNREYFNLRFFKLRKSSFVIAMLGLLVFILTLFCMKQQNDYAILLDGYYRQEIPIQKKYGESEVGKNEQSDKQ